MPPLGWYWRRLRRMGPREVAWRTRALFRDSLDALRVALPLPEPTVSPLGAPGFEVADVPLGEWARAAPGGREAQWRDRVVSRADSVLRHHLSFLGLDDVFLGDPIDWNRDHDCGRAAPLRFSGWIDYRNYAQVGDAKLVWEPNRHHQLVTLARAYRATGDTGYARAVAEQMDSWLRQCPYGRGMNWRSPLELAIRLINWVWALDLVRESGAVDGPLLVRVERAVEQHVREITRKYSQGSSANNHRLGEAAGVFVATSYWPGLPASASRREESRRMLAEEILAQTYPDGGTREQAVGYHLFVLQFCMVAAVVARRTGQDLGPAFAERLQLMLGFLACLGEGGAALPMIGDADDGMVLDLGDERDPAGWLAAGAVLFGRADLKPLSGGYRESARWLLGREGGEAFDALPAARSTRLRSRALPDSGYYLLQAGHAGAPDAVSVLVDAGELGMGPLAAHGHADALSVVLRVGGHDVLVDPGTYDYFREPDWRAYFRGTRAHNTVSVDGLDQSVIEGPFLWGQRARARCLAWEPDEAGGRVTAEHDGYTRLPDPVVHRRSVALEATSGTLDIHDELEARGEHDVALHFHFSEACELQSLEGHVWRVRFHGRALSLALDPRLTVRAVRGAREPILGWVSRGYHRKAAAVTVEARARCRGGTSFLTRLRIEPVP